MTECTWDITKHNGEPCHKHDDSYFENIRFNNIHSFYTEMLPLSSRNGNEREYDKVKDAVLKYGRGLSQKLDKPENQLSDWEKETKDAIMKTARPSPKDFVVYRKDDVAWLEGKEVGDIAGIGVYLGTTLDKDYVIDEIKGNVNQEIIVNVKKGDYIILPNNPNETEIDLINKDNNYVIKINDIKTKSDGTKIYIASLLKKDDDEYFEKSRAK